MEVKEGLPDRNIVKVGYKNTEIGIVPNDWEIKQLGVIGNFSKGKGVKKDESRTGKLPCVRYGEIYTLHHYYIKEFNSYISEEVAQSSQKIINGDILFAGSGETKEEIGKCVSYINEKEAYAGGDIVIFRPNRTNSLFLSYLLNTPLLQKQKSSMGQGDAVVHIHATHLEKLVVPLPPLPEQQAIAEVLSDTDNLIQSLEKQIAKKKLIKKGVMQELLKPKEGWEVTTLREIVKYRRGSFPQPYGLSQWYDENNGMPFVQVYDVDKNMKLKPTTKQKISELAKDKSVFVKKGSVILTIQGSIGRIAVNQYDAYVDRTLLIFTDYLIPMDVVFFSYIVQEKFRIEKQNAPGGIIKTITKEALSKFEMVFPKSKTEQIHIAKILSDMGNEIESMQKKLTKHKQIKQGLMQNLLTGKIRLV